MLRIIAILVRCKVALLAEGVDRNVLKKTFWKMAPRVALLAEGVDRNHLFHLF